MRFLILAASLFLTACAAANNFTGNLWLPPPTAEEQAALDKAAAEQAAKEQEAHAQEIIAQYRPMCVQLGFKEGTPEFGNCVLRLYENDQNVVVQDRASRRAASAAILSNMPTYSNPTTTTNCYRLGNSVNCTTR